MRCEYPYCEIQRFSQTWLMKLIALVDVGMILFFLYIMYQQLVLGHPFGNHPMSNTGLIVSGFIVIAISVAIFVLLYSMALIIEVRDDGIYFKLKPFHSSYNRISWNEIKDIEVVNYGFFRYGIGVHWGPGWKAYTLLGSSAIKIKRKEGSDIILSSIRPREFLDTVRSYLNSFQE